MLDTDTVIRAIRGHPRVRERLDTTGPADICVSAVTVAELWYGAIRHDHPDRRQAVIEAFLEPYEVLAFDRPAAELHGLLRHQLRHAPIGERDLFTASIASCRGITVVTGNIREFSRVPELRVEDWSA